MDRRQYTEQVLSSMRRVTYDERESIRQELDGHMEDHMEALRELGFDEQLAEERTLAAMGDPAEVGRELNRQYTGWGWVISGRIAKLVAVLLVVPLLCSPFFHDRWMGPTDYIKNRIDPDFSGTTRFLEYAARSDFSPDAPAPDMTPLWDGAESVLPLDIRLQVGNDELRVFRVSVG